MKAGDEVRTLVRRELGLAPVAGYRRRCRSFAAAALLVALVSLPAAAQAPYQEELLSGFSGARVELLSTPELADLDGDGDLDSVVGEATGQLAYFENTGSSSAPAFTPRTGTSHPLEGVDVGFNSAPALGDLDGDGDLDVFVGAYSGLVSYLENTGSSNAPAFIAQTGTSNPLAGVDVGTHSLPALADPDGDGDLDVILGHYGVTLRYFENTGTVSSAAFLERLGTANPFAVVAVDNRIAADLADLDGDGDLDLVTGGFTGRVLYYQNTGSSTAPAFVERSGTASPFTGIDLGFESHPDLVDLDGDGDLDAVAGEYFGSLRYLENTGGAGTPAFLERTDTGRPLYSFLISRASSPDLGDLDGDGDLDLVSGEQEGRLVYLENTGATTSPAFLQQTGSANPFDVITFGSFGYTSPALVDLDTDGDLDLVVGLYYGQLAYLENTGTPSSAAFVNRTGSANPFFGLDAGYTAAPDLADVDGDGDLDAVVGRRTGTLAFYRNTGTALAPAFLEVTGTASPFGGVSVGMCSQPEWVDLDSDGDLDVVLGESLGGFRYFENTGTAAGPGYLARTGSANPLDGLSVGRLSSPSLVDIDGDLDLDLLSGESNGAGTFFRSQSALFADGFESGDTSAWTATVP